MDRAIHLPPTLGFAPRRLEEGEFSPDLVKIKHQSFDMIRHTRILIFSKRKEPPLAIPSLQFILFSIRFICFTSSCSIEREVQTPIKLTVLPLDPPHANRCGQSFSRREVLSDLTLVLHHESTSDID